MDRKSHWRIALARRKRKARQALARWARRVGPDGGIDEIAELLVQVNRTFMKELADGR